MLCGLGALSTHYYYYMSIRSPHWNSMLCGRLPRLWRLFPWRWQKTAVRPPSRPWRRSSPDRSRRRTLILALTASTREPTVSLVVCCLYPSSSGCVLGSPAHIVSWHISFCELHGSIGQSRVFTLVFTKTKTEASGGILMQIL